MEPRKIQKVGYSTLSVSIPMNWAKKMNVKKGDIVFLNEENDGALRISPESNKIENTSVYIVNADECDNTMILARVIIGNYMLGRSVIRVESNRRLMREQIESIRKVTQQLLGIGIIEESDKHLLLQCSIDPKNFPLKTVVKRLYVITSIMFKETIDSLIDHDKELAKDAITREHEANTIFWLLARLLALAQQNRAISESVGINDPMEIVEYNLIAWYLEMIGDRLSSVAKNILKLETNRKENDNELIERLSQMALISFTMFDKAMKSITDKDIKVASDAVDLHDAVEQEEEKLLKEFQNSHSEMTNYFNKIAWELKIISEHSSAIAEISIDNILRSENDICYLQNEKDSK
ncbi:MAG: phosphate uptake regulator PhoU [Candidatus Bathyarchaeota archaeon]|nr:phosphate uptake regulator PhoU [Candidatus Bathyarchaeota archaeon]